MPKSYNIKETIKDDNGTIIILIKEDDSRETKPQVIKDINNGCVVHTIDKHNHKARVHVVCNSYLQTARNDRKCDNLGDL